MAAFHGSCHQLHAGFQLGAAALPVVRHKARVAADLPQAHEHREHRHLVLRFCGAQLFAGVHHGSKVELALFGVQLDAVDVLGLGRQLLEHLGLHAPQDERPGELVQPPQHVLVVLLHDGLFEPGAEGAVRRQIARHQEGKDAPQLAQTVFHRGAGEGEPHLAVHPADGFILLGGVVLDGLRLVQNAGIERLFFVKFFIPAQQVVAGDNKVGVFPLLCQFGTVSGVAVHRDAGKLWRELFAFFLPVQHQRRRADDEAGQRLPALLHGQQIAQHLHRLAQAHIVGQNAAHAVAVQRAQPAVAVPLVFAQDAVQGFRRGIFAVFYGVEAAADAPERIVPVEAQAVLPRKCPVQAGGPVERQFGVAVFQLCIRKFQRIVQLVQPFQTVVQPQQTSVPQAVVAFFLMQGLQQLFQLAHREFAGVHFQIQHATVHRDPHRDAGRRCLQIAEGIGQVDFALGHQRRDALFQQLINFLFVSGAVYVRVAVHAGLQIRGQQLPGAALGADVPQQPRRSRRKGRDSVLSIEKFRMGFDAGVVRRIQIELHHRFQRDLVQQQPFRIHDVQPAAQLWQHIAAERRCVRAGKEQAFSAQCLQRRQDPLTPGPLQPPEGIFCEQIAVIQPLHAAKRRVAFQLHAAPAALHRDGDRRQAFPQFIPAQKAGMLVHLHQRIKNFAGQPHAARRAALGSAVHPHGFPVKALFCVHLTAQQLQKLLCFRVECIPPVHKGQRLAVADRFAVLDGFQQVRDTLDHILPSAVRDAQPQPRQGIGEQRQLRFQPGKAGALWLVRAAEVFQRGFFVGFQKLAGFVVGGGGVPVPFAAEEHFQPGSVAVLPGLLGWQIACPAHHARDLVQLFRRRAFSILGGIFQQQSADVLAVGAVAVLVIGAAAGRADKAAVFPQPCLRIVTAAAAAQHHGREMAHAVLVGGAGALLDTLAVFLGAFKNVVAQQNADLVCVHGCSLPGSLVKTFLSYKDTAPRPGMQEVRNEKSSTSCRSGSSWSFRSEGSFPFRKHYFRRVNLFRSITASTMMPMTRMIPTIPMIIIGSVVIHEER